MKLVNIGCGSVFHPDWVNLDVLPQAKEVQLYDIRDTLPFSSQEIDACYSSHVLEHLTREQAKSFLVDCDRILKPGGIIRIVVPDLEMIARTYLQCLEEVASGKLSAESNYDWMILELLDQGIREFPGGEMGEFMLNPQLSNQEFILSRIGNEYWESAHLERSFHEKLKNKTIGQLLYKIRVKIAEICVGIIAGHEAKIAFQKGIFRQSGELHRWMYDRFSLERLLTEIGFIDIHCCRADESRIPNFNSYQLDIMNGAVRKPDSLFMEGLKP
ncbi:MAG: methyltransferase domain-containing protein [Snowella sp.]|nr:methyltransferase domain-containing protein [Snowella sp.]